MISTAVVALALSLPAFVAAGPFPASLRSLPRDVSHGALDEKRGIFMAYKRDGSFYGSFAVPRAEPAAEEGLFARAGSTCVPLSLDDVKKIPGWKKVEEHAKSEWGNGSYNLDINSKDYPDYPATACTEGSNVLQIDTGSMKCNTVPDSQGATGKVEGTTGELTLEFSAGTSTSMTSTVTKTSTFGAGASISANIGIPGIAEVSAEAHTSIEFKNEIATSFQTSSDNHQKQSLKVNAPEGSTCKVVFERKECNGSGHGSISTVAGGWVWFNYNDKTKGHYKWAANLEQILPDKKDRSSNTDFTSQLGSKTEVNYHAVCTDKDGKTASSSKKGGTAKAAAKKPADKPAKGPKTDAKKGNAKSKSPKPKADTKPKAGTPPPKSKVQAKPNAAVQPKHKRSLVWRLDELDA